MLSKPKKDISSFEIIERMTKMLETFGQMEKKS